MSQDEFDGSPTSAEEGKLATLHCMALCELMDGMDFIVEAIIKSSIVSRDNKDS